MTKADGAQVAWDSQKKEWRVRIQIGEEVIKRPAPGRSLKQNADEDALRSAAIEAAHADGYEIDPAAIAIVR